MAIKQFSGPNITNLHVAALPVTSFLCSELYFQTGSAEGSVVLPSFFRKHKAHIVTSGYSRAVQNSELMVTSVSCSGLGSILRPPPSFQGILQVQLHETEMFFAGVLGATRFSMSRILFFTTRAQQTGGFTFAYQFSCLCTGGQEPCSQFRSEAQVQHTYTNKQPTTSAKQGQSSPRREVHHTFKQQHNSAHHVQHTTKHHNTKQRQTTLPQRIKQLHKGEFRGSTPRNYNTTTQAKVQGQRYQLCSPSTTTRTPTPCQHSTHHGNQYGKHEQ